MTMEINKLAEGLAKFNEIVPVITSNKTVSYPSKNGGNLKFSYASLSAILGVIRKPLAECGLSILQTFNGSDLVTTLLHTSGQQFSSTIGLGISPTVDHKSLGAAITYMRRYAIVSLLNLIADEEDDDAEKPEASVSITPALAPKTVGLTQKHINDICTAAGGDQPIIKSILDGYKVSDFSKIQASEYEIIMSRLVARERK